MRSYFKKEDVEAIERANPELGQKTNVTPERLTT